MAQTVKFNLVVIFADELRNAAKALREVKDLAAAKPKVSRKEVGRACLAALSRMYNALSAVMDNPTAPIIVLEIAQGDKTQSSEERKI